MSARSLHSRGLGPSDHPCASSLSVGCPTSNPSYRGAYACRIAYARCSRSRRYSRSRASRPGIVEPVSQNMEITAVRFARAWAALVAASATPPLADAESHTRPAQGSSIGRPTPGTGGGQTPRERIAFACRGPDRSLRLPGGVPDRDCRLSDPEQRRRSVRRSARFTKPTGWRCGRTHSGTSPSHSSSCTQSIVFVRLA